MGKIDVETCHLCISIIVLGATQVIEKQSVHKVSGVDLFIHVIKQEDDMCHVLEQNMVFVQNVKVTTTEELLRSKDRSGTNRYQIWG